MELGVEWEDSGAGEGETVAAGSMVVGMGLAAVEEGMVAVEKEEDDDGYASDENLAEDWERRTHHWLGTGLWSSPIHTPHPVLVRPRCAHWASRSLL